MQSVIDLVKSVPAFGGRVDGAARLAELLDKKQLGQGPSPGAFVLPLGIDGGKAEAMAGMFIQGLVRLVGVLIVVRVHGDVTGAKGLIELEPLIDAVIGAIAGTADDDAIGTFVLVKGELASVDKGLLTYQLDFAVDEQLRIAR